MPDAHLLWPASRALIRIDGPDSRSFLQGIVSNDVNRVSPSRSIYAALLTPQGKYLHDFFIAEWEGALFLDCEAARRDDLLRRLSRFKLRSKVALAAGPADLAVALVYGADTCAVLGLPPERGAASTVPCGITYVDPRILDIGARAILPGSARSDLAARGIGIGSDADYDRRRIALGLPDGSRDLDVEKSILLENGFDELAGVDWDKGCYMGQELTARTHYRALIKKRLVPVRIEGPPPEPGTTIRAGEAEAGIMRSSCDGMGLALLRKDAINAGAPLSAGSARLAPEPPGWMRFSP
jgi:folate-binding protein YgfZ